MKEQQTYANYQNKGDARAYENYKGINLPATHEMLRKSNGEEN